MRFYNYYYRTAYEEISSINLVKANLYDASSFKDKVLRVLKGLDKQEKKLTQQRFKVYVMNNDKVFVSIDHSGKPLKVGVETFVNKNRVKILSINEKFVEIKISKLESFIETKQKLRISRTMRSLFSNSKIIRRNLLDFDSRMIRWCNQLLSGSRAVSPSCVRLGIK